MITKPFLPMWISAVAVFVVFVLALIEILRRKDTILYKVTATLRLFVICVLVFLVNLRPQQKRYNMEMELKNLDILFVTDTTISMWATDYDGKFTRMYAVQQDCNHIMDSLMGSNFSLIRFDNRSQILAPFTQDTGNVKDAITTISEPDRDYATGSSLNVPYDDMEDMLVSSNSKDERLAIVFFISDGENTSEEELRSYAELSKYIDGGAVLGYGSENGGTMKDADGRVIQDPVTGSEAVSKIDEENLKKIAEELGVDYIHMTEQENIEYLLDAIKAGSSTVIGDKNGITYVDTYYYYALPLVLMLAWEMYIIVKKGKW